MVETNMKNLMRNTSLLFAGFCSANAAAHTGIHTGLYHPLSGIDHLLIVLAIATIAGIAMYYYKR